MPCLLCNMCQEDLVHLFRDCSFVDPFWKSISGNDKDSSFFFYGLRERMERNIIITNLFVRTIIWSHYLIVALWAIRHIRNDWVFNIIEPSIRKYGI